MPTIGISIAVPDPCGTRLQDYRVELGDPLGRMIPTHITLAPPYDVSDDDLPAIVEHLAQVSTRHGAFRVQLRGTGTFRPVSSVVFVNVVEGISQCEQLAEDVRRGPLEGDSTFPYHPHVTVAHDLADDLLDRAFSELDDLRCDFEVGQFHLYVHDERDGWQVSRTFGLG